MHLEDLHVDGQWPELAGKCRAALIAEEYWHRGVKSDGANVLWIRVTGGDWLRLYIDFGTVYWRTFTTPPRPYTLPELEGEVRLRDAGRDFSLVDEVIEDVVGVVTPKGTDVVIRFENGRKAILRYVLVGAEDSLDLLVE